MIICDCELRLHFLNMFFERNQLRARIGFLIEKENDFIREFQSKDILMMNTDHMKYWMEKDEFSFSIFELTV